MKNIILILFLSFVFNAGFAQNSTRNGSWSAGSTWSGGSAPSGWTTTNVGHTLTLNTNLSVSGTLNIQAAGSLSITGNATITGGSTINVYGTLYISGDATLNSNLRIYPGGKVIVEGSTTVNSSNYLTIGTNTNPPPYADFIVMEDLISVSSGDVTVNRNARVAVFGDVRGNGGGVIFTINNGGQVYVDGDIALTGGGGNHINNNNTTDPFGFYVNGNISNNGGGSSTDSNTADKDTMIDTNVPFYNWVANLPNSPLPVALLYFNTTYLDGSVIVKWATATEMNSDYFNVQRSFDGLNFFDIGTIKASGFSSAKQEYVFKDEFAQLGRSYYRLKAVDIDGYTEYFNISAVEVEGKKEMSVYPNPVVNDELKVSFNFSIDGNAYATVVDISGTEVLSFQFNGASFQTPINLSAGVYFIKVQSGTSNFISRVVVK
ncbi:MAG TPA: T9SS type A sorting domain-containing protein [Ohtaekwangia sp.]|nr:T9SS type A sorting domain-containing protein [Ohtaekwangia sp.]